MSSPVVTDSEMGTATFPVPTTTTTTTTVPLEDATSTGTGALSPSSISKSTSKRRSTPYLHQVGGHGLLRQITPGKILKPMCDKELRFYRLVHNPDLPVAHLWLKQTTPHFYGEHPLSSSDSDEENPNSCVLREGGDQVVEDLSGNGNIRKEGAESSPRLQWINESATGVPSYVSPWAETMAKRSRNSKKKRKSGTSICLEDINEQFSLPCVLDCKIGQRHYGDDASPEKRRSHIEKSNSTTSARYGIRFTGMQSYKRGRNAFEFKDKYHGRTLKGEHLIPEMKWFFSDGYDLRRRSVALVLEKIKFIGEKMKTQTFFRFYSSSLLIVYEGDTNLPDRVDVRMIDFVKTQWDMNETKVDDGYLVGINTLIRLMETILNYVDIDKNNNAGESTAQAPTSEASPSSNSACL